MFERTKEQMKKWAVKTVMTFEMNNKAEMSVIKLVIAVFLIAILAGALLPTAIDSLEAGKNSSGTWTASETSTFWCDRNTVDSSHNRRYCSYRI